LFILKKQFVAALLLLTIPSVSLYPSDISPQVIHQMQKMQGNEREISYTPSYDELVQFLEEITSGEMEKKCSPKELAEINQFVAFLAKEGVLPEETAANSSLDKDIESLLNKGVFDHDFFGQTIAIQAAIRGDFPIPKCIKKAGTHCKNWISKRLEKCRAFFIDTNKKHKHTATHALETTSSNWEETKHFIEKHKVAIIVGVIIVVTVIVVTIVTLSSSESDAVERDKDSAKVIIGAAGTGIGAGGAKVLTEAIDDQITSLKEEIVHEQPFFSSDFSVLEEQGREYGSRFAHENLEYLINPLPLLNEEAYEPAHREIDRQFSTAEFSLGFANGLPHGIYDSGEGIYLLAKEIVIHPIHTTEQMYHALNTLSTLARSGEWGALGEALAPEVCELVHDWDTLSSEEKGEQSGYILGKYGADILIPGAVAKGTSRVVKGAKELNITTKVLRAADNPAIMESITTLEKGVQVGETIEVGLPRRALNVERTIPQETKLNILSDKQGKHLEGHRNFNSKKFKSIWEHPDPDRLVQKYAGTGIPDNTTLPGMPGYKEIVNCEEFVGYVVIRETGEKTPTTWAKIHYSKRGVHIVPTKPI